MKQGMEIETIMRNNKKRDIYFKVLVFWVMASWVAVICGSESGAPTLAKHLFYINLGMAQLSLTWWMLFIWW
jgi:hypothetical protein